MNDINHLILVDYFKTISENHKNINDFFRMDLTEIIGSFRNGTGFPCLVMESHDGDFGDSNVQSTVNNRGFAFTIYSNPERRDYDDQNEKLSDCEVIGLQVISRMKHDSTIPDHFLYNKFKISSVKYGKVGPVFSEKLYGYRFEGEIGGNEPLNFDPALWSDDPNTCT
ncbi:hypothetical protein [Flagellimonas sp.]|uniref:hypothetical protein n=1 Tax=Flagellimonas sp. TaxID=2058762 RepID=UPI003BA84B2D